jgi:hypothetical protein
VVCVHSRQVSARSWYANAGLRCETILVIAKWVTEKLGDGFHVVPDGQKGDPSLVRTVIFPLRPALSRVMIPVIGLTLVALLTILHVNDTYLHNTNDLRDYRVSAARTGFPRELSDCSATQVPRPPGCDNREQAARCRARLHPWERLRRWPGKSQVWESRTPGSG